MRKKVFENLIFEFLTQFFENLTKKTVESEKNQTFEKDIKKVLPVQKLLLADVFFLKIKQKNT